MRKQRREDQNHLISALVRRLTCTCWLLRLQFRFYHALLDLRVTVKGKKEERRREIAIKSDSLGWCANDVTADFRDTQIGCFIRILTLTDTRLPISFCLFKDSHRDFQPSRFTFLLALRCFQVNNFPRMRETHFEGWKNSCFSIFRTLETSEMNIFILP